MENYKGFVCESGKARVDKFVQNASKMHSVQNMAVTLTPRGPYLWQYTCF